MKKALLILFTLLSLPALADKVGITADAPDVVVSGDEFRISFTINSSKAKNFSAPAMDGFDVLMGPSPIPKIGRASCRERVSSPV